MALQLAIIGLVAGAVLGLRYNVLILVPAVMIAVLFSMAVGIARADGALAVTLTTLMLGAAVQIGYLAGAALNAVLESVGPASNRGRDHPELSTLRPAWLHTLQGDGWRPNPGAPSTRLSQTRPRV